MVKNRTLYLSVAGGLLAVVAIAGLVRAVMGRVSANAAAASVAATATATFRQEVSAGIDPGIDLKGKPAPDFTLTDQFGRQVSLHQFRGKVVIMAFTDSECTTICPLTSQTLIDALRLLPPSAAQQVQLLGVNANPEATSVDVVRTYSINHGLEDKWLFLTGSPEQLGQVWKAYHIYVQIQNGNIDHTPALYVIDRNGGQQKLYLTSGMYGTVADEARVLAAAAAPLLPGNVHVNLQLAPVPLLDTTQSMSLPRATATGTSGKITLGPGDPQLTFFFASWSPDIQNELVALNAVAQMPNAPRVIAVDVGTAEPSDAALKQVLSSLSAPLAYPVVVDTTGNIADAYHAQDIPWFTLTSVKGAIVATHDGWEPPDTIEQQVQQVLQKAP